MPQVQQDHRQPPCCRKQLNAGQCTGAITVQRAAQPHMKADLTCSTPLGCDSSPLLLKGGKPLLHLPLLCAYLMHPRYCLQQCHMQYS